MLADFDGEVLDRLLDGVAIIDVAPFHAQDGAQRLRIDGADVGLNVDRAEMVLRPLLDRESDDEALLRGVVLAGRGDDLHVGIAMAQVEAPDQIAVGFDAVGVIDVGGLQKAEEVRCRGLDHVLQSVGRVGLVADEVDGFDAGLLAFLDRENQIHAIVRPRDDLRHHLDVETPVAMINLDDALNVRLHRCARQRTARLRLDFLLLAARP